VASASSREQLAVLLRLVPSPFDVRSLALMGALLFAATVVAALSAASGWLIPLAAGAVYALVLDSTHRWRATAWSWWWWRRLGRAPGDEDVWAFGADGWALRTSRTTLHGDWSGVTGIGSVEGHVVVLIEELGAHAIPAVAVGDPDAFVAQLDGWLAATRGSAPAHVTPPDPTNPYAAPSA
jgi:hypothetical protein